MLGSGESSQAIWTPWDSHATASVRLPKYQLNLAWTRVEDVSSYATVDTSLVGGTDIVAPAGALPNIANADVFNYFDESAYALRLEYQREIVEPLGGIAMAIADALLDNTEQRFTPNVNSTIGTAIKPNRPMKMFIGFLVSGQQKLIPIIEGLTLQPTEEKLSRQVRVTAYDYMKFLNEYPLESTIYQSQRSDQIIEAILTDVGLGTSNYELDTGLNTIDFAWFEKGMTAGERIRRICEAEEAFFYQDEKGLLRFENRRHFSISPHNASVWTIEQDDILDWRQHRSTDIINRCIVRAKPRSVKSSTDVWQDGVTEEIGRGETLTIWASFENPVTGITNPVASTDYVANTESDGSGTDVTSDISIVLTAFTTSAKLEITNNGAVPAFLTTLKLRGTAATVDYEIEEIYQDDDSISVYDEHQLIIENDFIDSRSFAYYLARALVVKYKDPMKKIILTIRGLPQLQLRDKVTVKNLDASGYTNYRVMKIVGRFDKQSGFIQDLYLREVTSAEADSWAIVDTTTVGSTNEFVGQ